MTAPVWIRGILADEYGVAVDGVTYLCGGEEEPGRSEKLRLDLPSNFKVERIGPEQTLAAARGRDRCPLHRPQAVLLRGRGGRVTRLFEDYVEVERAYFRKTGIFPIMHTVVIRREVYQANPWIAQSLFKAFVAAQRRTYEDLQETAALKAMLPWLHAHIEEARREMGEDYWPYGFDRNRATLATFLRYHHEQGLSRRRLAPEALFTPETMAAFKI
jgi:4,5-dihydroxyphthalate decarboxylase